MKGALDVHQDLLGRAVQHEIVRLPRAVTSADELAEVIGLPAEHIAVVRAYVVDASRLVAALVPAGRLPHPEALLDAVGGRSLMPASPDVVSQVCDYPAALVSPLLLPPDVTVVVDRAVAEADVVYAATGDTGTALGMASDELVAEAHGVVADLCRPEPADWQDLGEAAGIDLVVLPGQPAHALR